MRVPISQEIIKIRELGHVPLGIISYDVENDTLRIGLLNDVDEDEASVILSKFGLAVIITESEQ